ncbi:MAG: hypothetical protein ABI583_13665 [Betaproteobacteria bacterium]
MLHDFLILNREELIRRCRAKVVQRFAPSEVPPTVEQGVPMLLQQIIATLRCDQQKPVREAMVSTPAPASTVIGRTAALHGAELRRQGYSVDQVVHDYGDVCQSVTELAAEHKLAITVDEFRTLNQCLDNAIADAVTSFGIARQRHIDNQAQTLHLRLNNFTEEHRRLVDIAIQSFFAIKAGDVGYTGATASLLVHTLGELRSLVERALPEIHLISDATTVTSR